MKLKKLDYPYPYKAWFALSNDPDHTTIDRWKKLHNLIWEELQLPFADSLFTYSFNQHLPEQISLDKYGKKLVSHPYDTLHSWGDFKHAGNRCFSRDDANKAVRKIKSFGIKPLVWTDHSSFIGNFVHHSSLGSVPSTVDAAGYSYENQKYSLDLACDLGVRYMWDGKLTPVIGQVGLSQGISRYMFWLTEKAGQLYSKLFPNISYTIDKNWDLNRKTYKKVKMPDGRELYFFRRFGLWRSADIDGFGGLVSTKVLKELVRSKGTCIMYTHLGKKDVSKVNVTYEITKTTIDALKLLKTYYTNKEINLSPVSELLDYCVIRDNILVEGNEIHFNADGIRFQTMDIHCLKGKVFSFSGPLKSIKPVVHIEGSQVDAFKVRQDNKKGFSIIFD